MPISFTCPHCGHETSVADQYAGQSGPCVGCGNTITVPGAGADALPASRSTMPVVAIVVAVVLVIVVVCGGLLTALMLPAVQSARAAARRVQCSNNMKQLALAMHNYHAEHGSFPPAYLADANGKPMHSWRVLILPYLGEHDLYAMYDFDEPWDSLKNQTITDGMPQVFRCPSDADGNATKTHYMMIVGPGTISDGPNGCPIDSIRDGASSTIMLVEAAGSGVRWSEPRDLDAAQISFAVDDGSAAGIGSDHPHGANVAFCDGSVHFFDDSIDPIVVQAMSTVSGAENVMAPGY